MKIKYIHCHIDILAVVAFGAWVSIRNRRIFVPFLNDGKAMLRVIGFKGFVYFSDGIVSENSEGLVVFDMFRLCVHVANDDLFRIFGNLDAHEIGETIDVGVTTFYFAAEDATVYCAFIPFLP